MRLAENLDWKGLNIQTGVAFNMIEIVLGFEIDFRCS
jgi:hypothetical protein